MFFFLFWLMPSLALAQGIVSTSAAEEKIIDELAYSKGWLRLMHYTPKWGGWHKGRADGKGFYFSSQGKSDPKQELRESLLALKEGVGGLGHLKAPYACAFPARTEFLQTHFSLTLPVVKCPEFEEFFQGLSAQGLSIIFASNYAQSSVSYFGHTFLRIDSGSGAQQRDILDYTFGFSAAMPPDASVWSTAIKSVYGNTPGVFDIRPYHMKIQEYNHMEARDLWEYKLNLSAQEARFFVKHLWELGSTTYFDYYFLDENCAYFILALLEAVKPEWDLLEQFPIYVIPGETVKALQKVGAIESVQMRPSIRRKMLQRESALSLAQMREFHKIEAGQKRAQEENDPMVLEMVTAYYSFRKFGQEMKLPQNEEAIYTEALQRMSQLPTVEESSFPVIKAGSRPDGSHHTFNLGVSVGHSRGSGLKHESEAFSEFSFKPAVHDLLNKDIGFNPNSQTDYLKFSFRYYSASQRFDLDEFLAVGMMTLIPRTLVDKGLSWGVHFGLTTPKDACYKCKAAFFDAQIGGSWNVWQERLSVYLLPLASLQASADFHGRIRGGPGLNLGILLNPLENYKLQLQAKLKSDLFQRARQRYFMVFEGNQSWAISQRFDARLCWSQWQRSSALGRNYQEAKFNFNYYY